VDAVVVVRVVDVVVVAPPSPAPPEGPVEVAELEAEVVLEVASPEPPDGGVGVVEMVVEDALSVAVAPVEAGVLVTVSVRVAGLVVVAVVEPPPPPEPPHAEAPRATPSAPNAATSDERRARRDVIERWRLAPDGLLQALARLAHESDRLGEDERHHRAQLLGLLLGRPLDVDAVDRRHRQIDRQLDRVVGPCQALRALHLLGELAETALQVVGVTEHSAEARSFHEPHGSSPPGPAATGR
jgi:hypothetical protein